MIKIRDLVVHVCAIFSHQPTITRDQILDCIQAIYVGVERCRINRRLNEILLIYEALGLIEQINPALKTWRMTGYVQLLRSDNEQLWHEEQRENDQEEVRRGSQRRELEESLLCHEQLED